MSSKKLISIIGYIYYVSNIFTTGPSDTKDEENEKTEMKSEEDEVAPVKEEKKQNQFYFLERATQTKASETAESQCQTDPPPM